MHLASLLRHTLRGLRRSPGYALVTIATLCVAIGANTAMFGVLHAVLLRELPYAEPARLVEVGPPAKSDLQSVLYTEYERWRDHTRSFETLSVHFQNTGVARVTLTAFDEPESIKAGFVSATFFPALGVAPSLGRVFTQSEEDQREPVAVLSDALWRKRFGAESAAIGATIDINGLKHRIIGVMPASFIYPDRDALVWVPLTLNREWSRRAGPIPFFRVFGRLAPGVTAIQAEGELSGMSAEPHTRIAVLPFKPKLPGNLQSVLYLLSGAVGFILLIACANIANLTLARGSARQSELALRIALGAGRMRVTFEMFFESLLLAACGAWLGILLGSVGIDLIVRFGPAGLLRLDEARLDLVVLSFSIVSTFAAALLFGLLPAWQLSRRDPVEALRGLTRGSSSGTGGVRSRSILVTAEVCLSVMLLAGAGLMIRSLLAARAVDPGFDATHALTMRVLFPDGTPQERRKSYFDQLFARLGGVPGVAHAAIIDDLIEVGEPRALGLRAVEGRPTEPKGQWTPLTWNTVGGRFFEAMGTRLIAGRWFTEQDTAGTPLVAVIDESMARRYWPNEDPVGKRFKGHDQRGRNDDWISVIGVVGDMRRGGLERLPSAHVFEWHRQSNAVPRYLIVRTAGDPVNLIPTVRTLARSLDSSAILSAVQTLEAELDGQLASRRFQTTLLGLFAGIGLALAIIGIFGVMNYSVAIRTREFGIRAALGASSEMLRRQVVLDALRLGAPGVVIGLAGAVALSNVLRSMLFGVSPVDPLSLTGACALLLAVAVAAALSPARKAGRIEPIEALRQD